MKTLLLLRHAKSSWKEPNQPDHERGLNDRGKHDAPLMGHLLREQNLVPDLIVSSTARRAHKTAEKVAQACGYTGAVQLRAEIYEAEPSAYVGVLRELPGDVCRVLVVGHNPGLEMLLEWLTQSEVEMPTAALAHVVLPIDQWDELKSSTQGQLERVWRPHEFDE